MRIVEIDSNRPDVIFQDAIFKLLLRVKKARDLALKKTFFFFFSYGHGPFAIAIVQLLTETHNTIISSDTMKQNEISLQDLIAEQEYLINFKKEDIDLLILANSSYELEVKGKGQITKLDIDGLALEAMAKER